MPKNNSNGWSLPSDEASDPGGALGRHGPVAFTTLMESEGDLGQQLNSWLKTNDGLQWLSSTLDTWEHWLVSASKAGLQPPTVLDLNNLILTKFAEFLNSSEARKLANKLDQQMSSGALMVPVYVVEELIKHRLKAMVKVHVDKNKLFYFRFFGWRMALGTTLLAIARRYALKAAGRLGKKWYDTTKFVTDVLLPPAVWGPALGVLVGLGQLTYTQDDAPFSPLPRPVSKQADNSTGRAGLQSQPLPPLEFT